MAVTRGFVGRADEIERLVALLASASEGGGRILLLGGEAGVGKTALLRQFLADHHAGRPVAWGTTPVPAGEQVPYAPFLELVRGVVQTHPEALDRLGSARAELGALLPPSAGQAVAMTGEAFARHRLFEAVRALLEVIANDRPPLVVVVDDLHWADDASLALLSYLAHQLRDLPVLLVGAYRSDDPEVRGSLQRLLVELVRLEQVTHLELGGLTEEELLALEIAGPAPFASDFRRLMAQRAAGNPYLYGHLVAATSGEETGLTPSVRELLLQRIRQLPAEAQQAASSAAVAGTSATGALIGAVMATGEADVLAVLRTLVRAVVLDQPDTVGAPYTFHHPLLQEALLADLLPEERAALHQRIAEALVSDPSLRRSGPAGDVELAIHWAAAGDSPDRLPALIAGADAAQRLRAFELAHAFLEHALTIEERGQVDDAETGDRRQRLARLRVRAAEAAHLSGDSQRATALAQAALADLRAAGSPVHLLLERLAWYQLGAENAEAALQTLAWACAAATEAQAAGRAEPGERARMLASHGRALLLTGRYDEARATLEAAVELARTTGSLADESRALTALGTVLVRLGQVDAGAAKLEAARSLDEVSQPGHIDPRPSRIGYLIGSLVDRATALEHSGRLTAAADQSRDALDLARRLGGVAAWGGEISAQTAYELFLLGRWAEAEAALGEDFRTIRSPARASHAILRARLAVARGQIPAALTAAEEARSASGPSTPARVRSALHLALAEIGLARNQADAARGEVERALSLTDEHDLAGLAEVVSVGLRANAERAALARLRRSGSDVAAAREDALLLVARAGLSAGAERVSRGTRGDALRLLCEAELGRVDGVRDADQWLAVAAAFESLAERYNAAMARWREAEALLDSRLDRARAEAALRLAHAEAADLGASLLRREVEQLARRSRIALADADEIEPPVGQPADDQARMRTELGLSVRELEVLALVADGRTNRQIAAQLFISQKTAGHHVSNILTKLGLSSRVEAAAVAFRHGLLEPAELPPSIEDARNG